MNKIAHRLIEPVQEQFRIISWNMAGSGSGSDELAAHKIHSLKFWMEHKAYNNTVAICLQGCGHLYGWSERGRADKELERLMGAELTKMPSGWSLFYFDDGIKLAKHRSAILIREPYSAAQIDKTPDPGVNHRLFGVEFNLFKNRSSFQLFSIHSPPSLHKTCTSSSEGQLCPYSKKTIELISTTNASKSIDWMCVGDFNCLPPAYKDFNPLESTVDVRVRRPGISTTKTRRWSYEEDSRMKMSNEFDYAYIGGKSLIDYPCRVVVDSVKASDHQPVHFVFAPTKASGAGNYYAKNRVRLELD